MKIFTPARLAACVLSIAAISQTAAHANFEIYNRSPETIYVSVLTTEVFRDGHVNQFKTVTLESGHRYDFLTNDVVNGRTVSVSIRSKQAGGRSMFDRMRPGFFADWGKHTGHIQWAPYWNHSKKKMGNKYVASEAARGNFKPLVNNYGGWSKIKTLQVVPKNGGKKGVRLIYNGFNNAPRLQAW